MRLLIQVCGNNELSWEEEWLEELKSRCAQLGLSCEVKVDDCHDLCTECVMYPYLILGRKVLMTEDLEQLKEQVLQELIRLSEEQGTAGGGP